VIQNTSTFEDGESISVTADIVDFTISKVYWTDLKDNIITKAVLGDLVRLHIETKGTKEEKIEVKIYEENRLMDKKFDTKKIELKDNKGYFEFRLLDEWREDIDAWFENNDFEFYCKMDDFEDKEYLKVTKNDVLNWTPKVDLDGKTYYISKEVDRFDNYNNISSFMLQYGIVNDIDYSDAFALVRKNEAGELCVLGSDLKQFINKDILKINNGKVKPTPQQMFDHFLFAIDKSRSLGHDGFTPSDYFLFYSPVGSWTGTSTFDWRNVSFEMNGEKVYLPSSQVFTYYNNTISNKCFSSGGSNLYSDGNYTTHVKFKAIPDPNSTNNSLGEAVSVTVYTKYSNLLIDRFNKISESELSNQLNNEFNNEFNNELNNRLND